MNSLIEIFKHLKTYLTTAPFGKSLALCLLCKFNLSRQTLCSTKRICLCTEGCSFLWFLFYNVLVLNLETQGSFNNCHATHRLSHSSILDLLNNQHSWREAKHKKWPGNICLFTQLKLKINWCAPLRILNTLNIRWLLIRNHHTKSGLDICRKKKFFFFFFLVYYNYSCYKVYVRVCASLGVVFLYDEPCCLHLCVCRGFCSCSSSVRERSSDSRLICCMIIDRVVATERIGRLHILKYLKQTHTHTHTLNRPCFLFKPIMQASNLPYGFCLFIICMYACV